MPVPVSRDLDARATAALARRRTAARACSTTRVDERRPCRRPAIAWMALTTRLVSTCLSWPSSASTPQRVVGARRHERDVRLAARSSRRARTTRAASVGDVDRRLLQRRAAARSRAAGGSARSSARPARRRSRAESTASAPSTSSSRDQPRAPGDDVERRAELVRDARRELADRGQPVGVAQLLGRACSRALLLVGEPLAHHVDLGRELAELVALAQLRAAR